MKPLCFHYCVASTAAILALTGCSALKPKPDLTRFYVLSVVSQSTLEALPPSGVVGPIVIGPSSLPRYLESTPIVVDDGSNRVLRLDLHQWAEPLDKGIRRVLAGNLSELLNTPHVVVYPQSSDAESGYDLSYTVSKCDGSLGDQFVLEVFWRVQERTTKKVLAEKRSRYAIPVAAGQSDPGNYVARMSQAIGQWSADIAGVILSP